MAIITDSIVDVGTYTTFNVGLSKYISQYSEDEIWNFPYCSSQWRFWQHIGDSTYNDFAPGGAGEPYNLQFPLKFTGRYESDGALNFDPGEIEYNNPGGIYCRIIWLYGTTTPITTLFPNNKRSITSGDNVKIITQMDMTKCRIHAKDVVPGDYVHPIGPVNQTNYINFDDFKIIENHDNVTDYMPPSHGVIFPAVMFQWNGKLHIFRLFQNSYNALDWSWFVSTNTEDKNVQGYEWDAQSLSFDGQQGVYFPINIYRQFQHLYPLSAESHESWTVDFEGNVGAIYQWWYGSHTGGRINPATEETYLEAISWYGMMFEHKGIQYKPIIIDGYVTGYTSDMSITSDIDNWIGATNHNVPPAPPGPTPSTDDDIDSMGFDGMSCNVGGPAKYYIMSYSDIHHLIGDFNAHAEPGTSISNNIISCYVNALDWNWSTGSEPIEIYSGGAQTVAFTSDINYAVLTGYNARDIIGSIDVPRMTNTFYDFSPYSTYEVYIPFCGWVALPDTVAGRHIKIYFETDEATCGCKGRVFFVDNSGNGVTVAEITGSFGAPCPIQVIEGGLYKQAMLSNGLQVIGGMASGIMGGAMGAGALAVSGLSSAMQSLGNCLIAGNTNYGQTIGRAGDASGLMCAGKPYLKITYPPIDEVVNNSMFGHTVGYLCNTVGQLKNFSGFTVCANPHITGVKCTDTEKEEIKRLLEDGVIL